MAFHHGAKLSFNSRVMYGFAKKDCMGHVAESYKEVPLLSKCFYFPYLFMSAVLAASSMAMTERAYLQEIQCIQKNRYCAIEYVYRTLFNVTANQ